ncbi:MAG: site-2 protease family protein [Oscillospiraceae bacterium]|nr:site-2 protease family protein [Oscillospiraceae bacterium]
MFIVLGILAFGLIIAIHEFGHYIAAKLFNVKVNEFAIGMGPKLLKKQGKETLYTLRALPFGGFCSMEGEHQEGEEPDPRSFLSQKRWRRIVILAAGSVANFIAAFIIIFALTAGMSEFSSTTLERVHDNFPYEGPAELMAGDRFVELNGERLIYNPDIALFQNLHAGAPHIFIIERDGELIEYESRIYRQHRYLLDGDVLYKYIYRYSDGELLTYERISFERHDEYNLDGERQYRYVFRDDNGNLITEDYEIYPRIINMLNNSDEESLSFNIRRYETHFTVIENNVLETIRFSGYQMFNYVRMIRVGLAMMISGAVGINETAGIVGIVDIMNTVGQQAPTTGAGIIAIVSLAAFIAVNVATINLLPIPALDGGRILFTVLSWAIEKITRKPLNPKYEAYINTGAFVLLIGLMIFLFYNDIMRIVTRLMVG